MYQSKTTFPAGIILVFIVAVILANFIDPPRAGEKEYISDLRNAIENYTEESTNDTLFINQWATWCSACMREKPVLANIADSTIESGSEHVQFFSATRENNDEVDMNCRESSRSSHFQCLYNPNQLITSLNALSDQGGSIPLNILIIEDSVAYKGGFTNENRKKKLLDALVHQSSSIPQTP